MHFAERSDKPSLEAAKKNQAHHHLSMEKAALSKKRKGAIENLIYGQFGALDSSSKHTIAYHDKLSSGRLKQGSLGSLHYSDRRRDADLSGVETENLINRLGSQ
mmetsp:Transcript_32266/g.40014  ORF Transcript_32266/g.40014 Transcript_32266/m.40014 type:complete len:104 (-) Transcript_32266:446-757(-)